MKTMKLNESMPVELGPLWGTLYGGPYRNFAETRRLKGLKMAVEIDHPHDIAVDTKDFSVPSVEDMQRGLIAAVDAFASGHDVYVGCMGGTGRTGTFMACMAKVMHDYGTPDIGDPVAYVRTHYRPHAVETAGQEAFVANFDTAPILLHVKKLTAPTLVEVPVEKVVERIVYRTPFDYALDFWKSLTHPTR